MITLDFDTEGLKALNRKLTKLSSFDYDQLVDEVASVQLARVRKRFLEQTAPDGSKWPESRAAQRRKEKGRGGGTLYDSGHLFRSIQATRSVMGQAKVKTDVPYARDHQFGEKGQVQRVFFGLSEQDITVIDAIVLNNVAKALNQAGL